MRHGPCFDSGREVHWGFARSFELVQAGMDLDIASVETVVVVAQSMVADLVENAASCFLVFADRNEAACFRNSGEDA